MNSKLFLPELGRTSFTPKKSAPIFKPSFDGALFNSMFEHRTADGTIRVGSAGADFPYIFKGVQTAEEFALAFLYIVYKDNSSHGVYTNAAKLGKAVYTHSMADKVKHWWALPDDKKYRGYRLNVL